MKKILLGTVLGLTAVTFSAASFAQFGGLGGALGGALGGSSGGSNVSADSLVKSYVGGTQLVMSSDVSFLKALGMKEQAEKEELAAKRLTEGPTSANIEEASKIQTDNSKSIAETMGATKVTMSSESKQHYIRGVVDLVRGIKAYTGMSADVKNFRPSITSLGSGATAAIQVAKSLPSTLTSLKDTLTRSIAFAKDNNIPLPADATGML